jgi:hypothetical protein
LGWDDESIKRQADPRLVPWLRQSVLDRRIWDAGTECILVKSLRVDFWSFWVSVADVGFHDARIV